MSQEDKTDLVLGIDIGASGIKAAIVDVKEGKFITSREKISTPEGGKPKDVAKVIKKLVDHFEWKDKVGCGYPGIIKDGVVKSAANVSSSWIDMPINEFLSEETGVPFICANDADVAGVAAITFGKGKGVQGTLLFITIGTGLGSALFRNGILIPNTEFGHLNYKKSVYEHYASNSARKKKDLSWEDWAKEFSSYLNYLDFLLSPNLILLGGGISKKFDDWKKLLKTTATVDSAALRNDAGIIGSAYLAYQELQG